MAWIKKTKVEKHLSLSLRYYNILYISEMHYFDGDRCFKTGLRQHNYNR